MFSKNLYQTQWTGANEVNNFTGDILSQLLCDKCDKAECSVNIKTNTRPQLMNEVNDEVN